MSLRPPNLGSVST